MFVASGPATATAAPPRGTEPGVDPQKINSAQARITWQVSQKNKLSVYNDRIGKDRGAAMTAGFDPATASIVWTSPIYTTGSAKWTSTATNKILVEAGTSFNYERYNTLYQPGIRQVPGSPAWYTTVNKQDSARGTQFNAGATEQGMYPDRFAASGSVSYVTGLHNIKVGVQDTWGRYRQFRSANGDLRAFFQDNKAFQATILNTPVRFEDDLKADVGIYGQDSWTINRLTLNYGARWEYFASGIPEEVSTPGRFSAARTFGPIDMPTWKSISPRGGAVYDLFGNQKTAIKFSAGKYMQMGTTGFSNSYNPLALTTANVAWNDLNGDTVPQGNSVRLSDARVRAQPSRSCRRASALPTSRPSHQTSNGYSAEETISVQYGSWRSFGDRRLNYRDYKNLRRRTTRCRRSPTTRRSLFNLIDGSDHLLQREPGQGVGGVDCRREPPGPEDVVAASNTPFNARLAHGITLFGGGMMSGRSPTSATKGQPQSPALLHQTKSGLPWRTQFVPVGAPSNTKSRRPAFQASPILLNVGGRAHTVSGRESAVGRAAGGATVPVPSG